MNELEQLRDRLTYLRDRFLRCDSESLLGSAMVEGGCVAMLLFESGKVKGFEDIIPTWKSVIDGPNRIFAEKAYKGLWLFLVRESDDPNANALKMVGQFDGGAMLSTKPDSVRERAERYAAFCMELVRFLDLEGDETKTKIESLKTLDPLLQMFVRMKNKNKNTTTRQAAMAYRDTLDKKHLTEPTNGIDELTKRIYNNKAKWSPFIIE